MVKKGPLWKFALLLLRLGFLKVPQVSCESTQVGIMPDPEIDRVLGIKERPPASGLLIARNKGATKCRERFEWGKQGMKLD